MEGDTTHTVLDHVTDIAAIGALTWLAIERPGEASDFLVGAITSIAIGQRYAKHKWGNPPQ
jgi:hypothetical protein